MGLPTRNLDDRTFQSIVDEAKKRVAALCPDWTDHNVSDPGVTLIELFAWMTEMILYRLNQVPDKHQIKLLELLGIRLQPPEPAGTKVTFYLSMPQPEPILIPAGTEVATKRIEAGRPVIFSTDETLNIYPAKLIALITERVSPAGGESTYQSHPLKVNGHMLEKYVDAFNSRPNANDSLYFGFVHNLSRHLFGLDLTCQQPTGIGIDPTRPPWRWEVCYSDEAGLADWRPVEVESDTTGGMEQSGQLLLRLPDMTEGDVDNQRAYWLRCRVDPTAAPQQYAISPRINTLEANSWGGFVQATHTATVYEEILGRSDGTPGQIFHLEYRPFLQRLPYETLQVREASKDWESWVEVPNFTHSTQHDKHFTCDSITGEIRLGPALRQRDGTVHAYGMTPPRNAELRFSQYRYGGGAEGNIQTGALTILKTTIPYVDRVTNRAKAEGGADTETIDLAKMRAINLLYTRQRAVTAADYEFLTWQGDREILARASGQRVQRVRCLAATAADAGPVRSAGQIDLLVVPRVELSAQPMDSGQFNLKRELRDALQDYLDTYRLLTVRLRIRQPVYYQIAVRLVIATRASPKQVEQEVEVQLYRFLNPISGGPAGDGWPFGRPLYSADIYACLRDFHHLEFIEPVRLYRVEPDGREEEIPAGHLDLPADGLIISGRHKVVVKDSKFS